MSSPQHITRVLVTGGSGILGSHIVQQLLTDPAISVAVVSRAPKVPAAANSRVSYHSADVSSLEHMRAIFEKVRPQAAIHTASPHHTDTAAALERTNVEGTKVLLECARTCPDLTAFVYTSSHLAVVPIQQRLSEDQAQLYTASHFTNPYGRSKAIADALVLAANAPPDLYTAVIRLSGIYGENDTNFIAALMAGVRKKEHKVQVGQNKKLFEFVYVAKAAEAHILAMRALLDPTSATGVAGEAFFISDDRPEPFFDFARRCYAAVGTSVDLKDVTIIPLAVMQAMATAGEWAYKIFTLGTKTPQVRRDGIDYLDRGCCWSIEKAKRVLGYQPVEDQDAAIKRSMEWALANV